MIKPELTADEIMLAAFIFSRAKVTAPADSFMTPLSNVVFQNMAAIDPHKASRRRSRDNQYPGGKGAGV